MSRTPPYGYSSHHVSQTQPNYYYDESDGYGGDYMENEPLPDSSHMIGNANVTEIYRRKSAARRHLREQYRTNVYCAQPAYYYEHVPSPIPPPVSRAPVSHAYTRHIPIVEERTRYYTQPPVPLEDGFGDAIMYSATPASNVRRIPAPHPMPRPPSAPPPTQTSPTSSTGAVRRHPVTVRTPRYYRRVPVSNVYKKPSALCLPISAQPDPAVCRRSRRVSEDSYHNQNCTYTSHAQYVKPLERRHSVPVRTNIPGLHQDKPPKSEPTKDVHLTQSDVDAVLARYETIFGEYSENTDNSAVGCITKRKPSKTTLSTNLKPKVPSSLKHNQEQLAKLSTSNVTNEKPDTAKSADTVAHLKVEQITTDVLDSMLSELMQSGCENKINEQPKTSLSSKVISTPSTVPLDSSDSKDNQSQFNQSFNYQDISKNFSKSQQQIEQQPSESSQKTSPRPNENTSLCLENTMQTKSLKSLNSGGALDLHHSKSYIVSLIDRALSKELGTPEEKHLAANKAIEYLDARQAVDIMSRQANKMDKELCMEISKALTDSFMSSSSDKRELPSCLCTSQMLPDEPLYVKQLKQLRWGHLKHIQTEVRRLEDLERFLDSCTSHPYPYM